MNYCNKEDFSHIHVLFKCVNWAFVSKIAGVSAILATNNDGTKYQIPKKNKVWSFKRASLLWD